MQSISFFLLLTLITVGIFHTENMTSAENLHSAGTLHEPRPLLEENIFKFLNTTEKIENHQNDDVEHTLKSENGLKKNKAKKMNFARTRKNNKNNGKLGKERKLHKRFPWRKMAKYFLRSIYDPTCDGLLDIADISSKKMGTETL